MAKSCESNRQEQHQEQDKEIKERLSHIKNKILVMSGKGGVGKSSIAAYLAVALAKKGYQVGLMDIDLHGPSIPRMLGIKGGIQLASKSGKALPVNVIPNLHVISIESLMGENKDAATIWRGPIKIGVIRQFISDMEWSDLDYLIIDSPPGTGDEPLTIAQTIPDSRAFIVTTPQEVSLADVRKSINFCRQIRMDILGMVENMNGFKCPHCGKEINIFKSDGGRLMARNEGIALLGSLPIDPDVVTEGDKGMIPINDDKTSEFFQEFNKIVDQIEQMSNKEALCVNT
jgi:Mrp family chromosome partitioning ATPase